MPGGIGPAPRARQAHLMRFRGVAHPTGERNDYDGLFLTKKQIKKRAQDVVGTPIWCEHNGMKKVGWVTAGRKNGKKQLSIDAVIDRNSLEGARVARAMRAGKLVGLSLGLDHMVREDPATGTRRVVSKTIEEISVTADPDRPDTFVSDVAPDSEMWDLTRQRVVGGLEKRRTKNALNKKRTELLGLFKQATADWEADRAVAQLNTAHTKESAEPGADSIGQSAVDVSMSEQQQQQQQQQQPGEAPAQGGDLSELEAMRQKLARIEADKQTLQAQLSEQDGMVQAWRDNPEQLKVIVARHNAKLQSMQEKMAEDEQEIIDKVTADMIAAGVDPSKNQEIFDTIKNGKDQPEAYKPLYTLLKTTAGAASEKRATAMEAEYQAKNAENARLLTQQADMQRRLDTVEAARIEMESQFQQQQNLQKRADGYAGFVSGLGKRARTGEESSKQEEPSSAAAPAAAAAFSAGDDAGMFFGGGEAPSSVSAHAMRIWNPMADVADDATKSRLLALFEQGRAKTGMGRFDVPSLTGKDYGKVTEGLNPNGTIDARAHEIRSQRPPIAFAADALHQA